MAEKLDQNTNQKTYEQAPEESCWRCLQQRTLGFRIAEQPAFPKDSRKRAILQQYNHRLTTLNTNNLQGR